ncbi:MAG TPA: hypothetical protein VFC00_40665 [Micromonosporaceae bacterium]|nr:hypothetical protein [Micromonosporaceae bacterium]
MNPRNPTRRNPRLATFVPPGSVPNPVTHPSFTILHRRGKAWIDEVEVQTYVGQVTRELADRDRHIAALTDELHRHKTALAEWQHSRAPTATDDGYLGPPVPRPMRNTEQPHQPWPPD